MTDPAATAALPERPITVALAGDTMLGRSLVEPLAAGRPVVSDAVAELTRSADLFVCNLECCISERGEPWPDPHKPFFFRAPPVAADALAGLGADAVTLANNHALDFGSQALLDTLDHLERVGIACTGAGPDADAARQPVTLAAGGLRVAVAGLSDHPADFAAADDRPGIAYADLRGGLPRWVGEALATVEADVRIATPHWGPNMVTEPVGHVRGSAPALASAGADLIAGHSAHVFHGVGVAGGAPVLFDLGDFVDDYAVDPVRRNDLGLLWLVELAAGGVQAISAVPLHLDFCYTDVADGVQAQWVGDRLQQACSALGTVASWNDGRLVVEVVG